MWLGVSLTRWSLYLCVAGSASDPHPIHCLQSQHILRNSLSVQLSSCAEDASGGAQGKVFSGASDDAIGDGVLCL